MEPLRDGLEGIETAPLQRGELLPCRAPRGESPLQVCEPIPKDAESVSAERSEPFERRAPELPVGGNSAGTGTEPGTFDTRSNRCGGLPRRSRSEHL